MASNRRKRERRAERRAAARPPARLDPPTPRSTFRVARAQQALAEALPSTVRNRAAERRSDQGASPSRVSPEPRLDQGVSPSRPAERETPAQLNMRDQVKTCKSRPDSNRKKTGGGSQISRGFVPWC